MYETTERQYSIETGQHTTMYSRNSKTVCNKTNTRCNSTIRRVYCKSARQNDITGWRPGRVVGCVGASDKWERSQLYADAIFAVAEQSWWNKYRHILYTLVLCGGWYLFTKQDTRTIIKTSRSSIPHQIPLQEKNKFIYVKK